MASPSRLEIPPSSGGDMERVFRVLDADGDGKISESELGTVVRALGSNASPEEVKTMIGEMDSDQDGFVDMKEFAEFNAGGGGDDDAELRDAFDMYDLDHNGVVSASELHLVLKRLGDKSSVHDCARMISSLDKDGDGCINFEEFKVMMSAGSKKIRPDFVQQPRRERECSSEERPLSKQGKPCLNGRSSQMSHLLREPAVVSRDLHRRILEGSIR